MSKRGNKSLTLVELMIVSSILMIGILALWQVYIRSMGLITQAKEKTIAVNAAKGVLEQIRCVDFPRIPLDFPNGTTTAINGVNITVTYPQGTTAEPLEIKVTASWVGQDKRNYTESFATIRSRGL